MDHRKLDPTAHWQDWQGVALGLPAWLGQHILPVPPPEWGPLASLVLRFALCPAPPSSTSNCVAAPVPPSRSLDSVDFGEAPPVMNVETVNHALEQVRGTGAAAG